MSIVKRSLFPPATSSFFDDYISRDLFNWSNFLSEGTTVPRVNIVETGDDFRVEMAAPGLKKEDFHVELDNDTLTIYADVNDEAQEDKSTYKRREFRYQSFRREFYLPNTIEIDRIKANYKDGILSMVIPKKEEARRKPVRTIPIS